MHYEGSPNHPLPVHNYEVFNEIFRRRRRELFSQLSKMRALEDVYATVVKFVDEACIREAHVVDLSAEGITVSVKLTESSLLDAFSSIADRLGTYLKSQGFHKTGEPTVGTDQFFSVTRKWYWYVLGEQRVTLAVDIPTDTGCFDYMVVKSVRHSAYEEYVLERRPESILVELSIYDRIAARTVFKRQEVKQLLHGLGYNGDPPALLSQLGYTPSDLLLEQVVLVKYLMEYYHAHKDLPNEKVSPAQLQGDVYHEQRTEAVLQSVLSEAGEGPAVHEPEATSPRHPGAKEET